jgi:hypothetical protein
MSDRRRSRCSLGLPLLARANYKIYIYAFNHSQHSIIPPTSQDLPLQTLIDHPPHAHNPIDQMASKEKNPEELAKAQKLNHVPGGEDYDRMISGMLFVLPRLRHQEALILTQNPATTPVSPLYKPHASRPAPGPTNTITTSHPQKPTPTSTPSLPTGPSCSRRFSERLTTLPSSSHPSA